MCASFLNLGYDKLNFIIDLSKEVHKVSSKLYYSGFSYYQFKQNKSSFIRQNEKDYKYVEIGCINISDGSIEPLKIIGAELPANAKIKLFKNDVVVSDLMGV